jgi:hypothetical protein
MKLITRLERLEKRFQANPIRLKMADGSEHVLTGYSGDKLLTLFARAMREEREGQGFSPDVDAVRRSVNGTEVGGLMVELIRGILNSPQTEEVSNVR